MRRRVCRQPGCGGYNRGRRVCWEGAEGRRGFLGRMTSRATLRMGSLHTLPKIP